MADDHKARIGKIQKLMDTLVDLRGKEQAVLDEIAELAGGGDGIGAKLKTFETGWQVAWSGRYEGATYAFQYASDRPQEKRLLKLFGMEELLARAARYITDDDPFYVRNRHPFRLFVSAVNKYAAERPGNGTAASEDAEWDRPIGCQHTPPCRSDSEHTQRRLREGREARH